ncbi:MAG: hypothetical protein KF757_02275 [Phycisphaeraceae bacterium]|nr:hypothetical protein [Phycisphaeraceae bacterium]MCW5762039.1 hypothetical protein [Phycisphaeraceae bacterium]
MTMRLGELLVEQGLLTDEQRRQILLAQEEHGRPFGVVAEEMFGIDARSVEQAWAVQFSQMAEWMDPTVEAASPDALAAIDRRQAWQFRIVPLRFEGRELVVATDTPGLPRAMRFVGWRIPHPCRFVLSNPETLDAAIRMYYPMGNLDPSSLAKLAKDAFASGRAIPLSDAP